MFHQLRRGLLVAALSGTTSLCLMAQPPAEEGGEREERRERQRERGTTDQAGPRAGRGGDAARPDERGGPGMGRGGPEAMFRFLPIMIALDSDKDGTLSEQEIQNATAALKSLDKNSDGQLSADELRPDPRMMAERGGPGSFGPGGPGPGGFGPGGFGPGGIPAEAIERMMEMDKNNDGKLSKEELPERMQPMLARVDANQDGFVTKEELTAMRGEAGEAGQRSPEQMLQRMFAESDGDQDGKLSKEEAPARLSERFDDVDANADGFIDRQEFGAVMGRMMGRGGPGGPGGRGPGGPDRPRGDRPSSAQTDGDND